MGDISNESLTQLLGLLDANTINPNFTSPGGTPPADPGVSPTPPASPGVSPTNWLNNALLTLGLAANAAAPIIADTTGTVAPKPATTTATSSNVILYIIGGVAVLILGVFLLRGRGR